MPSRPSTAQRVMSVQALVRALGVEVIGRS
jgi:hypothetical protein